MKNVREEKRGKTVTTAVYVAVPLLLGAIVFFSVTTIIYYFMNRTKRESPPLTGGIRTGVSETDVSENDGVDSHTADSSGQDDPLSDPLQPTDEKLSQALDRIASSYGAAAVQVAVIRNGKVCACYNYGKAIKSQGKPVTTDTAFRAASLSKLIDAMAVMKLSEEGKMKLDTDIGVYLGYKAGSGKYPSTVITPRMLMTHTSGIVDSRSFLHSRNSGSSVPLKKLLSQSSSYSGKRPGKSYRYSNFGVAVLAAAAEKQAGQPLYAYTENTLFRPLGIKGSFLASRIENPDSIACLYDTRGRASYTVKRQLNEKCSRQSGQTHHIYQGNITISAADYARLLCVLLNNGSGENGIQILSPKSVSEILKEQYHSGKTRCCLCNFVSDGIVKGRTMHYHTGSNFGMYAGFAFDTGDSSGVVVLTSGANAKKEASGVYNICGDIIRKIYDNDAMTA